MQLNWKSKKKLTYYYIYEHCKLNEKGTDGETYTYKASDKSFSLVDLRNEYFAYHIDTKKAAIQL